MDVCGRWFESCSDHYSFMGMLRALSQNMWNLSGGWGEESDCSDKEDFRLVATMKIIKVFRDLGDTLSGSHFWIRVWMLFPSIRYQSQFVSVPDIRIETHFLRSSLVKSSFLQDKFSAPFLTNLPIQVLRQCWGKRSKSPPNNFCGRGGMYLENLSN